MPNQLDGDDFANRASIKIILADFCGLDHPAEKDLQRLAERLISEVDYTNDDLKLAMAYAFDGWEIAKGIYQWPHESLPKMR